MRSTAGAGAGFKIFKVGDETASPKEGSGFKKCDQPGSNEGTA